jgi:hypothetical protein
MAPLPPLTRDSVRPRILAGGRVAGSGGLVRGPLYSRNSIELDKYSTGNGLRALRYSPGGTEILLLSKYARLAKKIGLDNLTAFAVDMDKFRTRPSANYDIRGRPFSSIDDGTFWTGGNNGGLRPGDPRVAKVKSFLRRHLNHEPYDKDVDWVIYTYFGSDAFDDEYSDGGSLYYGIQDSFYNERGRYYYRNYNGMGNSPPIRRAQKRLISMGTVPGSSRYYDPFGNNFNRNNLNSNSNSNNTPTTTSRITWEKKFVKNMPTNEAGSLDNFKNGNKVIQYKVGRLNKYMSQNTFIKMAKMSPNIAYNKPRNRILFKNPFTRENVKAGEINFVILKDAATKIQSVVRGKKARNVVQTAARRKLLANTATKRKQGQSS